MIKQLELSHDPLQIIPVNALFPHKLSEICRKYKSRLIHFSTDCVFSGSKGFYKEVDEPDARDLYGLSKLLGEVVGENNLTIRTSIIGPELKSNNKYEKGGLSGKPLYDKSNEVISFISKMTGGKLPIIGVGGISTPEHALNKIKAGAHLIQLYTGIIYEGPGIASKINKELLNQEL